MQKEWICRNSDWTYNGNLYYLYGFGQPPYYSTYDSGYQSPLKKKVIGYIKLKWSFGPFKKRIEIKENFILDMKCFELPHSKLKLQLPNPEQNMYYIFKSNFSSASFYTHNVELLDKLTYYFLKAEMKQRVLKKDMKIFFFKSWLLLDFIERVSLNLLFVWNFVILRVTASVSLGLGKPQARG